MQTYASGTMFVLLVIFLAVLIFDKISGWLINRRISKRLNELDELIKELRKE